LKADLCPQGDKCHRIHELPRDVQAARGVLYVGHLPFGFFEEQIKEFFSQFGAITRIRLARNPLTGKSRHHGWIEFETKEVADVVADAMNDYWLFGRRLSVQVVPSQQVHFNMFRQYSAPIPPETRRVMAQKKNQGTSGRQRRKRTKGLLQREALRAETLKQLGLDYNFEGYRGQLSKKAKEPKSKEPKLKEPKLKEPQSQPKAKKAKIK